MENLKAYTKHLMTLKRALQLKKFKVYGKLLKWHQGQPGAMEAMKDSMRKDFRGLGGEERKQKKKLTC